MCFAGPLELLVEERTSGVLLKFLNGRSFEGLTKLVRGESFKALLFVRRRLDPRAGAALVWGTISAGRAPNVIPSTGECQGTLRMLDAQAWLTVGPLLEEIVHAVVQPYGVQAKVERVKGVPPVVNTSTGIEAFRLASLAGGMHPVPTSQSLGGEASLVPRAHPPARWPGSARAPHGGPTYDLHQGDLRRRRRLHRLRGQAAGVRRGAAPARAGAHRHSA